MNRRLRSTMICLVGLGALFPVLALRAAVPNQSVESLKKNATHIVVGTVTKISHETTRFENGEDIKSTAEISVTAVEKGAGIAVGDVIKVRYWNRSYNETNSLLFGQDSVVFGKMVPTGSRGHHGVPEWFETTRVYLTKGKGRGYDVEFPNGFESIKPEAKPVKPEAK